MNKLELYIQELKEAGLTEAQIDSAVMALNNYLNARLAESKEVSA